MRSDFSEVLLAKHVPKSSNALLQDLFAVGNEEEAGGTGFVLAPGSDPAFKIEGGDHGFTGAGCGDDHLPLSVEDFAFVGESVEDLLLKGMGDEIEEGLEVVVVGGLDPGAGERLL